MPTLFTVFEDTVHRHGTRTAVEVQRKDGLDRFSYADLHRLTLDRTRWLADAGVQPGDRCAILAHNDAHWCAAYLAILAVGGVVVPFDTNYSGAQVATILRDAGARVLLASERLRETTDEALAEVSGVTAFDIHAAEGAAGADAVGGELPGRTLDAGAPAVILYTSGTTSDPKGVVLSHANLIAERDGAFAVVAVSEQDSVLGVLPLFHSLAQLSNLLLPFAVGARVVFLETLSSQELVRALAERSISVFACVPQFFYLIHERVMREVGQRGAVARTVFRGLLELSFRARRMGVNLGPRLFGRVHAIMGPQMRLFVTGGSKFDPAIGRDFYALGFTILQAYGLTETSGAATLNTPDEAHIDTVGRPLPGTEIKVLPGEGDLDGEIAIRGPLVMQGYFGKPEATAAVLMPDGWFLTGDLGRTDAEGRLTITGRRKEVIILANGKNLYPEEIEAHYRKSPFVKEICVTTRGAGERSEHLYGVVVADMDQLRERKVVNAGDLLRFEIEGLSADLPSYKRVLGYEVWFEPLPRTTTGKLKRHEIVRRLGTATEAGTSAGNAPRSREEEKWLQDPHVVAALAVIRRRTKEDVRCRPASNLELDLGLDSMERVELLTELEQQFGVKLTEDQSHAIFTLQQLIEAVRPSGSDAIAPSASDGLARAGAAVPASAARAEGTVAAAQAEDSRAATGETGAPPADAGVSSWDVLLHDLPPPTDPVLGSLLKKRPIIEALLPGFGLVVSRLIGRIDVRGLEHLPREGAFLICPNHQSYVDVFVLLGVLPKRTLVDLFFVGAVEYFETAVMAWTARKLNIVPVDPDSNLVPAMKAGAFGLSHGKVLMLFPEGERSIDGRVRRFKKGASILATHLQVPIVPVAIRGAHEIWPRGRSFTWSALLPWSRRTVSLRFGSPMHVARDASYTETTERLRERVEELWEKD